MPADLGLIGDAVFRRIYQDAEGAAVRAKLGGAVGQTIRHAIHYQDTDLPPPPFLAYRRGPAPQIERVLKVPIFYWYAYDSPDRLYRRIEGILAAICAAYRAKPLWIPTGGVIGSVEVGDEGPQIFDEAWRMCGASIRVLVYTS